MFISFGMKLKSGQEVGSVMGNLKLQLINYSDKLLQETNTSTQALKHTSTQAVKADVTDFIFAFFLLLSYKISLRYSDMQNYWTHFIFNPFMYETS